MSTETATETSAPVAGAAEPGQTAPTGQESAAVAQPQTDEAGKAAGETSQGSADQAADEALTGDQRTIRKLQRRVERLIARRGGDEQEKALLRQELQELRNRQQAATGTEAEGTSEGQGERPTPTRGRQLTEADIERISLARAQELHRQQTISQRVSAVLSAGSKLEGFNAAVDAVAEVVPFRDSQGRPSAFMEAVLDADDPAAVFKHLGDNPDEAEEFVDLTPAQIGRRLAKLEDRLKAGAKKETSAAPKPLKPVATTNAGTEPDPSKMSDKEFAAWRRKQIASRGNG